VKNFDKDIKIEAAFCFKKNDNFVLKFNEKLILLFTKSFVLNARTKGYRFHQG